MALALAAVPTAVTLAVWIAVALPAQKAVASPYGWIPRPDLAVLLDALTGSVLLTPVLAIGLLCAAARRGFHDGGAGSAAGQGAVKILARRGGHSR